MSESSAMTEIRRIRDENSLRHLSMSKEAVNEELDKSVDWFLKAIGKTVPVISQNQKLNAG